MSPNNKQGSKQNNSQIKNQNSKHSNKGINKQNNNRNNNISNINNNINKNISSNTNTNNINTNIRQVRVRFAPSPTGYLHIGSARTCLFNWLFAKKHNGSFVLRIEDTDIRRHQENTITSMIDSLKWLGISWDEGPDIDGAYGPYRQSQRIDIYNQYAQKLIQQGKAYYCFCTPEELGAEREAAEKEGKFYKYNKKCLNLSEKEIKKNIDSGKEKAIRLLVPQNKTITFKDNVYGTIAVNSNNIEDFIIIRSNRLPTYNFSVAIDDALMEITHIIRGEDHLSNTPKQLLIYNAIGLEYPNFTHLPMILGQDGQKLSKRHGSISIEAYREEGYLPEAILNYLALLGWSYDEKTTIFSIQELIGKFSLDSINKKPAKFDNQKLLWINGYYIRNMEDAKLAKMIKDRTKERVMKKITIENGERLDEKIAKIVPLVKERVKTLKECDRLVAPFFVGVEYGDQIKSYFKNKDINPKEIIDKTIQALSSMELLPTKTSNKELLSMEPSSMEIMQKESHPKFNSTQIEKTLRSLSEKLNLNFRKFAEVIRIAIWGSPVSPPLFETIEILGKDETLKRLKGYKNALIT